MSFKGNIPAQSRGFYFDPSTADDSLSGQTPENPKQTIQAAIDAAFALTPTPSAANTARVTSAQGGSITGSFILQDGIQFLAPGTSITSDSTTAIELASSLICTLATLSNNELNGICYKIDGKNSVGPSAEFIGIGGVDGVGFKVTGACNDIFLVSSLATVTGLRGIVFDIDASSDAPIDANANTVELNANDSTFIKYNPPNASDILAINVSSVVSVGAVTGEVGFDCIAGTVLAENAGTVDLETVCHVHSGATLVLNSTSLKGDIIVDVGGTLTVMALEHSGTVTNNGTIDGRLGSQLFGTWELKPVQEFVLTGSSSNTQEPSGTDSPIQVEFGAAQFGSSDPVEIDVLGNITINQTDQYIVDLVFHAGRTGAGSFAVVLFRLLINGVQIGDSMAIRLDNANTHAPVEILKPLNLVATDVLTVEIWRDPSGFDAGGVFPETPSLSGSNPVPSAAITMTRYRLTPLV